MKKNIFAIHVIAISFLAIFIKQVGHESAHGILATIVGAKWTQLNLFFADHVWIVQQNQLSEGILTGGAAIVNIIFALVCAMLFKNKSLASKTNLRLFLYFLTAYNLFAGFGYLFTDPLFYQAGGENLGDWKKIVDMLGGGWNVRLPISLIGAAGVFGGFFWVAKNAHVFLPAEKPERFKFALLLLLLPYIVNNIIFITLATIGSLPPEVVPIVAIQYIFGYFGIGWGAFMAGLWIPASADVIRSPNPESITWSWIIFALISLAIAIFILLPTVQIG